MKRIFTARGDRAREWDERHAANEASRNRGRKNYWNAIHAAENDMVEQIRGMLPHSENLTIHAQVGSSDGWEILIGNSEGHPAENEPLTWSYRIMLNDDGTVWRKTSSWSGLDATTLDSVTLLRNTVDTIEAINRTDWTDILNTAQPDYKDYKEPEPYGDEYNGVRPDFDAEDLKDTCEEIVGDKHKAILSKTRDHKFDMYYFITHVTPKFISYISIFVNRVDSDNSIDETLDQYGHDGRNSFTNFAAKISKDWEVVDVG